MELGCNLNWETDTPCAIWSRRIIVTTKNDKNVIYLDGFTLREHLHRFYHGFYHGFYHHPDPHREKCHGLNVRRQHSFLVSILVIPSVYPFFIPFCHRNLQKSPLFSCSNFGSICPLEHNFGETPQEKKASASDKMALRASKRSAGLLPLLLLVALRLGRSCRKPWVFP